MTFSFFFDFLRDHHQIVIYISIPVSLEVSFCVPHVCRKENKNDTFSPKGVAGPARVSVSSAGPAKMGQPVMDGSWKMA
jgi:hypothetical protein